MGTAMITIRPFLLSDIPAAAELEGLNQAQPWSEDVFNDELVAENRSYLVAEDDRLVGFAGAMVIDEEAHITNLLVAPDHRQQGIGSQLVKGLIEVSIGMGAKHLTLEVRSENSSARRLYSRFGLVPVGARPGYYGDEDAMVMWVHDIDQPGYLEGLR